MALALGTGCGCCDWAMSSVVCQRQSWVHTLILRVNWASFINGECAMTVSKVQHLFTRAPSVQRCVKTEPKATPWLLFGAFCGRAHPRPFPPVLLFPVCSTGVAGWAGNRGERIALQGVCPRLCVVFCRVCPGALKTTAVQEKEKTLQRMKRKKKML